VKKEGIMKGHIEVIAAIVRVGGEADEYGKPYDFACAVAGNGRHATIKALVNPDASRMKFGGEHRRAIARELGRLGFTSYDFERVDDDGSTKREVTGIIGPSGELDRLSLN